MEHATEMAWWQSSSSLYTGRPDRPNSLKSAINSRRNRTKPHSAPQLISSPITSIQVERNVPISWHPAEKVECSVCGKFMLEYTSGLSLSTEPFQANPENLNG